MWWLSPRSPTPKGEAEHSLEFKAGERGRVWGRERAAARTGYGKAGAEAEVVFKRGNLGGNCDCFKKKQSPGHQGHTGKSVGIPVCYLVTHLQTALLWVRLCVSELNQSHFSLHPPNSGRKL